MTIFILEEGVSAIVVCDICGAQKPALVTEVHSGDWRYSNIPSGALYSNAPRSDGWATNSGPFFAQGTDEHGHDWFEGGFTDFCGRCA